MTHDILAVLLLPAGPPPHPESVQMGEQKKGLPLSSGTSVWRLSRRRKRGGGEPSPSPGQLSGRDRGEGNQATDWLAVNPFGSVPKANEQADPRRHRRAMTEPELVKLLAAARERPLLEALTVRKGPRKGERYADVRPEVRARLSGSRGRPDLSRYARKGAVRCCGLPLSCREAVITQKASSYRSGYGRGQREVRTWITF
jgi:hypothetical protein